MIIFNTGALEFHVEEVERVVGETIGDQQEPYHRGEVEWYFQSTYLLPRSGKGHSTMGFASDTHRSCSHSGIQEMMCDQ